MEHKSTKRRQFLKTGLGGLGLVVGAAGLSQALADTCGITPKQTEGPFYPVADQPDKDNDLTFVKGGTGTAKGTPVLVRGTVMSTDCLPIKNAVVEIWQACYSGRYNHPLDAENSSELDKNFQYWGIAVTGPTGAYEFKTIIPGSYLAAPGWTRPPHIHYKVHAMGYQDLTTQMYFKGDSLNDVDLILQQLSSDDKSRVIVEFNLSPTEGLLVGQFDITLKKVVI